MNSFLYLLLLLLFTTLNPKLSIGQALQNDKEIVLLDSETKEILIGTTAFNLSSKEGFVSNASGILKISNADHNDEFEFRYLGYWKKIMLFKDIIDTVYLDRNTKLIDDVIIVAEKVPQALTKQSMTISDFVMDNDRIILLSKNIGDKYYLRLTDLTGNIISELDVSELKYIEHLVTSCFNSHFLVGKNEVLQLHVSDDEILIIDRSKRNLYDQFIEPCLTQSEEFIYFEKRKIKNQIASIFKLSKDNGTIDLFTGIADEENLKRYKYDAPYMNYVDGTGPLHLGIHAENAYDALEYGEMLNRNFYIPVDYYMMCHENKVLLFDHEKYLLKTFDQDGVLISENPIEYPKQKGWKSKDNLYLDRVTNKLYAIHRYGMNLFITQIDLNTGESINRYRVKARFIENIAVHNEFVYYTNSGIAQSSRILNRIKL